jgi:ABC-type dipeptide/oligopeptide/nickel transport system ATPase subunit
MQLLFLKPGSHIMLAGPSGSGKTLLAKWFLSLEQQHLEKILGGGWETLNLLSAFA